MGLIDWAMDLGNARAQIAVDDVIGEYARKFHSDQVDRRAKELMRIGRSPKRAQRIAEREIPYPFVHSRPGEVILLT